MSVQTQIDRISRSVSAALAALAKKGVTVPAGTKVDGLAALIAEIESGGGSGGNISYASGTFIVAENCRTYELSHNLGRIPKGAFCGKITNPAEAYMLFMTAHVDGANFRSYTTDNAAGTRIFTFTLNGDITSETAPPGGAFGATENKIIFGGSGVYAGTPLMFYSVASGRPVEYKWAVWG